MNFPYHALVKHLLKTDVNQQIWRCENENYAAVGAGKKRRRCQVELTQEER